MLVEADEDVGVGEVALGGFGDAFLGGAEALGGVHGLARGLQFPGQVAGGYPARSGWRPWGCARRGGKRPVRIPAVGRDD